MAAKLGRGVLRFVGGKISKSGNVAIVTPVAVIGVRGGIALIEHSEDDGTQAVFLFGDGMTVTRLGPGGRIAETRLVTRPGFAVTVSSKGNLSAARRASPAQMNGLLGALEARQEQGNGSEPTTEQAVSRSGSAYTADSGSLTAQVAGTRTPGAIDRSGSDEAQSVIQDRNERYSPEPSAPAPSSPALWVYNAGTTNINYDLPFMRINGSRFHPLTIVRRADEDTRHGYRGLRIRSRFSGTGAGQEALSMVLTGWILGSPGDEAVWHGWVAGSARGPATLVDGDLTSDDMYLIWSYNVDDRSKNPSPVFDSRQPAETLHTVGAEFEGTSLPIYIRAHDDVRDSVDSEVEWTLAGPPRPVTHYGSRGERNWRGYAAGLFERHDGGSTLLYSLVNRNRSPDDVNLGTNARASELYAIFQLGPPDPDGPGPLGPSTGPGGIDRLTVLFGRGSLHLPIAQRSDPDINAISGSRSAYVSDRVFAAISSVGLERTESGDFVTSNRLIWVNDKLVPNRLDNRMWLYNNDAAPADGLLPAGVKYCKCPAVKFGWWGGRIRSDEGEDTYRDDVFPGTFVVGSLPDIADIPVSGTASYAGHAAAAIHNNGSTYAAVGSFTMNWNFATRTGSAAVTGLDGRDYAVGNLAATTANPRDFHGTLVQTAGTGVASPASGPIDGSFFSDGNNPVRDTGGQFSVTSGDGYRATGSFAATQ